MTGEISASVTRMWDDDVASRALGITLHEALDGRARASMTVGADMVNGHGMAHGGYLFLLADTTFACACNSAGPTTVAAGADIVFVTAALEGDVLDATADLRSTSGRSGVYDVTVTRRRDDQVVAEFRGRSRTIGKEPPR